MDAIKTTVRDYILEELLPGENPDTLGDATPLITGGVMDSISTVRFVFFLEERFGVEFQAHEISPETLDSVASIVDTVRTKMEAR